MKASLYGLDCINPCSYEHKFFLMSKLLDKNLHSHLRKLSKIQKGSFVAKKTCYKQEKRIGMITFHQRQQEKKKSPEARKSLQQAEKKNWDEMLENIRG